jgi:hypothetical protein
MTAFGIPTFFKGKSSSSVQGTDEHFFDRSNQFFDRSPIKATIPGLSILFPKRR